jgi:protein kinase-like protein
VLEQLGSGGMGVVYRARDARLQRDVAIKVLPDGFLGAGTPGQASHDRFLREARSASSLNHPNICTIHDVGEQDGTPYLVMELLHGETLKETLKAGALPLGQVLEFAIQITRGLEEAHEAGIIHRERSLECDIAGRRECYPDDLRDHQATLGSDRTAEADGSQRYGTVCLRRLPWSLKERLMFCIRARL